METNRSKQRQQFYRDYVNGQWSMNELCWRYQISRPTGNKWIDWIEQDGLRAVDFRFAPKGRSRPSNGSLNNTGFLKPFESTTERPTPQRESMGFASSTSGG